MEGMYHWYSDSTTIPHTLWAFWVLWDLCISVQYNNVVLLLFFRFLDSRKMWGGYNDGDQQGHVSARMETSLPMGTTSISVSQQQSPKKFAPVVAPKPKSTPINNSRMQHTRELVRLIALTFLIISICTYLHMTVVCKMCFSTWGSELENDLGVKIQRNGEANSIAQTKMCLLPENSRCKTCLK